jgi:hypothetical protein
MLQVAANPALAIEARRSGMLGTFAPSAIT